MFQTIFVSSLIGALLFFLAVVGDLNKSVKYDKAIAACELKLPRDQHCEISAVPEVKKNGN
jgi:hypothetical protein